MPSAASSLIVPPSDGCLLDPAPKVFLNVALSVGVCVACTDEELILA